MSDKVKTVQAYWYVATYTRAGKTKEKQGSIRATSASAALTAVVEMADTKWNKDIVSIRVYGLNDNSDKTLEMDVPFTPCETKELVPVSPVRTNLSRRCDGEKSLWDMGTYVNTEAGNNPVRHIVEEFK